MKHLSLFLALLLPTFVFGKSDAATFLNVPYKRVKNVKQNLLNLDLYIPKSKAKKKRPVMIYVHGGAWVKGDKSRTQSKIKYFNDLGYIFVSVNYRLSPNKRDKSFMKPDRVKFPIHNEDVADAISWISSNISDYGGDRNQISLIGHSAGGAIVAAVSTDQEYLKNAGFKLPKIKCSILLDSGSYDISKSLKIRGTNKDMYYNAFAKPQERFAEYIWEKASPINQIEKGEKLPNFFIVGQGRRERMKLVFDFRQKIIDSGNKASEVVDVSGIYNHKGVNTNTGHPRDLYITPQLTRFLKNNCQKRTRLSSASVMIGKKKRTFNYYRPKNSKKNDKPKLVIAYHGGNGSALHMAETSKLHDMADKNNLVIIYPNAAKDKSKKQRFWNDGRPETAHLGDDIEFTKKLIEVGVRNFQADRNNVFAVGLSNGGIFTHRLFCQEREMFKGFVTVVANMPETVNTDPKFCDLRGNPKSYFGIFSEADTKMPYRGGSIPKSLKYGVGGNVIGAEETYQKINMVAGCDSYNPANYVESVIDPVQDVAPKNRRLKLRAWGYESTKRCSRKAFFEGYVIENGDHGWPSPSFHSNPAGMDIETSDRIINFINKVSKEY